MADKDPRSPEGIMDITLSQTKGTVDLLNELQKQLDLGCGTLIPLARTYLEDLRSIRMAFANEVANITSSVQQLNGITKNTPQIKELTTNIAMLVHVLNTDTLSRLEKLFPKE